MTKVELFDKIFDYSKTISKEYQEYIGYCGRAKGLVYSKPKEKMEQKIELLLYMIKRHRIMLDSILCPKQAPQTDKPSSTSTKPKAKKAK